MNQEGVQICLMLIYQPESPIGLYFLGTNFEVPFFRT